MDAQEKLPENDLAAVRSRVRQLRLRKGFARLWVRHEDDALRLALHLTCNDRDDAKELLQESLVKAFKWLRGGGDCRNFSAWFKRIVSNCSADRFRGSEPLGTLEDDPVAVTPGPDETAASRDVCARLTLALAIGAIPVNHERAFRLRYLDPDGVDRTFKDIAILMTVAETDVNNYVARGRNALRDVYEKLELLLALIPPPWEQTIRLHYLNGRSSSEIAEVTRMPEEHVSQCVVTELEALRDAYQKLESSLRTLDSPEEQAVRLRYLAGFSPKKVAEIMTLSEDKVNELLANGLQYLRVVMESLQ